MQRYCFVDVKKRKSAMALFGYGKEKQALKKKAKARNCFHFYHKTCRMPTRSKLIVDHAR